MNARTTRDMQNRDASARPKLWQPAGKLPTPNPVEGFTFKWVRKSITGASDATNMSRNMREGWEPCRAEDHPELMLSVDADAKNSGLVEVGGLVLCKLPIEMAIARAAYYRNLGDRQMESVDNNLMRENDARMPLFNERKSKITFGRGE